MIQVNLLPDIKMAYIRAQRSKRLVIGLSFLISAALITVVALMALFVYVNQQQHTARLQKDIDRYLSELQDVEGLGDVLTIQSQLATLPQLYEQKPALTRLPQYLNMLVPNNISLRELDLDFSMSLLTISGAGTSQIDVNTFADVLKNCYYTFADNGQKYPVFSGVEFDIGVPQNDKVAFTATAGFDATIFDITQPDIVLTVPQKISTQSALRSDSLFDLSIPTVDATQEAP